MIEHFLDSWQLFQNTYLAGGLIALTLSLVGVFVVVRDQIFLGAAVSQTSTFGVAFSFWIAGHFAAGHSFFESDLFTTSLAIAFSILAAVITSRGGSRRESHEAITGWLFLATAAGAPLIVAHSPRGLDEVHKLLSSSIIGADITDVWIFSALFVCTSITIAVLRRPLLLLFVDEEMAASVGMNTARASFLAYVVLGLVVGLSIQSSGLLFAFGMLVLPGLIAKNICQTVSPMLLVAPILALAVTAAAFVFADHYDLPPAQLAVLLLAFLLLPAWAFRRWRY